MFDHRSRCKASSVSTKELHARNKVRGKGQKNSKTRIFPHTRFPLVVVHCTKAFFSLSAFCLGTREVERGTIKNSHSCVYLPSSSSSLTLFLDVGENAQKAVWGRVWRRRPGGVISQRSWNRRGKWAQGRSPVTSPSSRGSSPKPCPQTWWNWVSRVSPLSSDNANNPPKSDVIVYGYLIYLNLLLIIQ